MAQDPSNPAVFGGLTFEEWVELFEKDPAAANALQEAVMKKAITTGERSEDQRLHAQQLFDAVVSHRSADNPLSSVYYSFELLGAFLSEMAFQWDEIAGQVAELELTLLHPQLFQKTD